MVVCFFYADGFIMSIILIMFFILPSNNDAIIALYYLCKLVERHAM